MVSQGYIADVSELGKVYYPEEGIHIIDKVVVKYVDYPWISCFEVEGIKILKEESKNEENDCGFPSADFNDILYSSDNKSGGNEYVSDIEQSFGICGSE